MNGLISLTTQAGQAPCFTFRRKAPREEKQHGNRGAWVYRAFSYLRLNNARIFCQNVSSGAFTGLVLGAGFLTADLAVPI